MEVKLFANLAEEAGTRRVDVDLDGSATLEDTLEAVFETHPGLREQVLDGDGNLVDHINVLVNGTAIDDGLDRNVDPSDEVAVFPPVSGGL